MVKHFNRHRYFYIAVLSVLIVYIIPLLFIRLPLGHDVNFHLTRIQGISDELRMGHFPVRIYSTAFFQYGYAAPLFYGDWLLYFPALLVLAGVNVITAYKVFICVCLVLASLSMYFSGKIIFGDKSAACVASVLYALSTYIGTDALIRHANGEFQSFIFLPIAFAGLYDIIFHEGKRWLMLPLGMCGIMVTHTLSAALTVFFLAVFALVFIKKLLKPKKILLILASVLAFLLLSASFLFPMIEQLKSNKFLATDGTSANWFGTLEFRSMPNVFSLFWLFNTYEQDWFIPQGVGFTFLFMIILFVVYFKKVKSGQSYVFLALSLFALFMTSCYFPWEYLQEICGVIQFPWRIMLFASFFIALFSGTVIWKLQDGLYKSLYIFIAVMLSVLGVISTIFPNCYHYATIGNEEYRSKINVGNSIGLGEYLPTGTDKEKLAGTIPSVESNHNHKTEINSSKENGCFTLYFSENNAVNTYFDLPLIMYKGYKATLTTDKGTTEIPLDYGMNNLIRITIGSEKAGTIKVWYEGTAVQKISFIVSTASFGAVLGYLLIVSIKKRKNKNRVVSVSA